MKRILVNGRFCTKEQLKEIREREKSDIENNIWKNYSCVYNNRIVRVSREVDSDGDVEVLLMSNDGEDYVEKVEDLC